MEILLTTHLDGCRINPCRCSPNSRIHLFENAKRVHAVDPHIVGRISQEIETLRKVAVIYTHSPHLLGL